MKGGQEHLLFSELARASLLLDSLQQECLEPFGLTFVDYTVVRILDVDVPEQKLSPSKLAELAMRSTGGMSKIVDRLEAGGLVERISDPADRRGVLVALTEEGCRLGRRANEAYRIGRNRVLLELDPAQRHSIEAGLHRLVEIFERDRHRVGAATVEER